MHWYLLGGEELLNEGPLKRHAWANKQRAVQIRGTDYNTQRRINKEVAGLAVTFNVELVESSIQSGLIRVGLWLTLSLALRSRMCTMAERLSRDVSLQGLKGAICPAIRNALA